MIPRVGDERLDLVRVKEHFPEDLIKSKETFGELHLCVRRESLPKVIEFLKTDSELQYTYFAECVGADYSQWTHERDFSERFEVVYHLGSLKHYSRIFVKVGADDGQKVPSIKPIFLGADYPEREIWDMFGIEFEGNEQTQRFLMPDDWVGHPLRKEFPLGGEDIDFDKGVKGPAVEDRSTPHAGESFEGKTGSKLISGR
jgi:NADH-quinone oxidoreductase subunit C